MTKKERQRLVLVHGHSRSFLDKSRHLVRTNDLLPATVIGIQSSQSCHFGSFRNLLRLIEFDDLRSGWEEIYSVLRRMDQFMSFVKPLEQLSIFADTGISRCSLNFP